jgi:hypothetical protein
MAGGKRNDFSRPPALWTLASVPNARDFSIWDRAQYQGIDGDNGGTWAPASPIGIGGNGVQLSAPSLMAAGFTTRLGGRYLLGTANFPVFQTPQARTVSFPFRGITGSTGTQFRRVATSQIGTGIAAGASQIGWTDPIASTLYCQVPARWVHDGATLTNIAITAFLATPPATPTIVQRIGLIDSYTGAGVDYGAAPVWQASHFYAIGATVIPTSVTKQNGCAFTTPTTMTSGSTEPTWNTSGPTPDGTGTWQAVGGGTLVMPSPFTTTAFFAQGTTYAMNLSPHLTLVMDKSHPYMLYIVQDAANPAGAPNWVYTSVQFGYTAINDFRFE